MYLCYLSERREKVERKAIAAVVGSNPTRSTFISLVNYGIELSSILVIAGQKA
jgi:hypothetical protein